MRADLFAKVARAVQRGSLPKDLTITYSLSGIDIVIPWMGDYRVRSTKANVVLAWLQRTFPDGETKNVTGRTRPQKRYRQKQIWLDTHRWSNGAISFAYEQPHEHRTYAARSDDTTLTGNAAKDFPVWRCTDCHKPISTTRARELGLLPPKAVSS